MLNNQFIIEKFGFSDEAFIAEFHEKAIFKSIKAKTEIATVGQRNAFIPFVINGVVRVFTLNDGRELIYYYVKENDCCMMTFSSIFSNYVSRIYAVTEVDSDVLLVPVSVMHDWLIRFPDISISFFKEYDKRFSDVMHMVNEAVFHKLDKRVLNFIKTQVSIKGENPIKLMHKEIASNLGTSREVISRVMKKIENEGEILQSKDGILVFDLECVSSI